MNRGPIVFECIRAIGVVADTLLAACGAGNLVCEVSTPAFLLHWPRRLSGPRGCTTSGRLLGDCAPCVHIHHRARSRRCVAGHLTPGDVRCDHHPRCHVRRFCDFLHAAHCTKHVIPIARYSLTLSFRSLHQTNVPNVPQDQGSWYQDGVVRRGCG